MRQAPSRVPRWRSSTRRPAPTRPSNRRSAATRSRWRAGAVRGLAALQFPAFVHPSRAKDARCNATCAPWRGQRCRRLHSPADGDDRRPDSRATLGQHRLSDGGGGGRCRCRDASGARAGDRRRHPRCTARSRQGMRPPAPIEAPLVSPPSWPRISAPRVEVARRLLSAAPRNRNGSDFLARRARQRKRYARALSRDVTTSTSVSSTKCRAAPSSAAMPREMRPRPAGDGTPGAAPLRRRSGAGGSGSHPVTARARGCRASESVMPYVEPADHARADAAHHHATLVGGAQRDVELHSRHRASSERVLPPPT